jgi:hypothetical protein
LGGEGRKRKRKARGGVEVATRILSLMKKLSRRGIASQLREGSMLEALLKRAFRLVFWVLLWTPLILVPIWYLFLAPLLGPILGPLLAPLLKP